MHGQTNIFYQHRTNFNTSKNGATKLILLYAAIYTNNRKSIDKVLVSMGSKEPNNCTLIKSAKTLKNQNSEIRNIFI